jgi:hypothetical protein
MTTLLDITHYSRSPNVSYIGYIIFNDLPFVVDKALEEPFMLAPGSTSSIASIKPECSLIFNTAGSARPSECKLKEIRKR